MSCMNDVLCEHARDVQGGVYGLLELHNSAGGLFQMPVKLEGQLVLRRQEPAGGALWTGAQNLPLVSTQFPQVWQVVCVYST